MLEISGTVNYNYIWYSCLFGLMKKPSVLNVTIAVVSHIHIYVSAILFGCMKVV